ncbi:hypothetical protein M6B38_105305 [Iris pallida]|uniref:Photosystem II protein I n=1 Tax=Iris pallida TaxID=29817 RepID=A0AAX6F3V6_IRIPA|nr:hypothetical protein M6B38_105305 [Iris pallida]
MSKLLEVRLTRIYSLVSCFHYDQFVVFFK